VRYQTWFTRIGLVGLALCAVWISLRIINDPYKNVNVNTGPVSTIPGDGSPVSTPANVAVPFSIITPVNGSHSLSPFLTLVGLGPAGATISYGEKSVTVTDKRSWAMSVQLVPGRNDLTIMAKNSAGESSSVQLTVFYDEVPGMTGLLPTTTAEPHDGPSDHPTVTRPGDTTTVTPPATGTYTTTIDTTPTTLDTTSTSDTTPTTEPTTTIPDTTNTTLG
jgi:hypothetical protein